MYQTHYDNKGNGNDILLDVWSCIPNTEIWPGRLLNSWPEVDIDWQITILFFGKSWQDLSCCMFSKYIICFITQITKHTTTFWWFAWWSLPNMALDCVNFNVHFETSCVVSQLCPDDIFKQVSNPVELHDVFWLTL